MKIRFLQRKKTVLSALFVLLLSVAGMTNGLAQTFTVGNLNYSLNGDGVSVTVIGHVDGQNATGELVIPESVELYGTTYPVTVIGEYAFQYCNGLTGDLVIPNSVITIGNVAFFGCSGFTGSLVIPNSVITIGGYAFCNCSGFTGSLVIPNSVITIGGYAFSDCSGFTGVLTIPESLTSIGLLAFLRCSSFTTLSYNAINCSIESDGQDQLWNWLHNCSSLSIVNIGENVQSIPNNFLLSQTNITGELIIPNSVTSIGANAFNGCSGFTGSLSLSSSVTSIGENAFNGCSGFTGLLTISNSVISIGSSAFNGCSGFTGSLILSNSVTSIGENAFNGCSGFTGSLTIPNAVSSIGANAFSNCAGFSGTLTIGNSVSEIGNSAFFGACEGFTSFNIWAETPPTLGTNALTSVNYSIPVQVPCGTLDAFQNAEGWNSFTNIQEPNPCLWEITATATDGGSVSGAGTYEQGQTCTLTATPNTGVSFVNWTEDGVEVSTEAQYSFTVTGNRNLVAHFVVPTYTINVVVNPSYGGSFAYDGEGTLSSWGFENGTIPTMLNNSVSSYPWTIWSSNTHDGSYCIASNNTNVDSSESAIETTVEFVEDGSIAFWWRISSEGNYDKGYFYINGVEQFNRSGSYNWNRYSINLSAGTYTFRWSYRKDVSWSNNEDRFFIDDITFTGAVGNEYQVGQTCTLTATPSSSDFVFLNWTENGNVVSTNAQYPFTVTNDRNLVANFNQIGCEITASASPEAFGTVRGGGHFAAGQTCTLIATPNEGYYFINWTENGEVVSTNATYSFTAATHRNLVAHFWPSNAILFADPNVETICVNNWDSDGDGYLSYDEAAAVTSLGNAFQENHVITSFDELQYFTGLTSINNAEFYYCNNLVSITIPIGVTSIGYAAFGNWDIPTYLNISYYATNCSSADSEWLHNCTLTNLIIGDNVQVIPDNFVPGQSNLVGTLTIPASVTSIGGSAFANCSGFTGALILPASLTSIGGSAFANCTGFTGTLSIPATVTSIGGSAFENCAGFTGTLTIPEAVTSIGARAFAGTGFTTLNFDAVNCGSLYWYGSYNETYGYHSCLVGLNSLTTLNIGNNVQTIPEYAFKDFSSCTGSLVIPNSVTIIGGNAFNGCAGYSGNLIIPSSVTTIGNSAFANCTGFETLTIGPNVTSIGNSSFAYMNISIVNFNAINCSDCSIPFSNSNNLTTVNIGNSVQVIPDYIFNNCTSLTGELIIPESVISIGIQAFYNCSNLTALNIGNNVQTISNHAFRYCDGLMGELILPESLVTIGNYAFNSCSGFTGNLVIPNSVSQIGYYSFWGCSGLTGTLTIGESVLSIGYSAFSGTNFDTMSFNAANCEIQYSLGNDDFVSSFTGCNTITRLNFGETVQSIPSNAFRNLDHFIGDLVLPNSLITIGDHAFYNCYGLEGIVMGNSVETIGSEAFRNCGGLRGELTLPETLQSVGTYAFASCDELNTINYNAINCTEMGNAQSPVFYDCASIQHINIGENVESIPNYAFKRCSTVTDMSVAAVVPPTIEASTFGTVSRAIPVNVPFGSGDDYRSAQYWEEFFNITEGIGQNNYTNHWHANSSQFPFNMTAIGIIQIDGVEQSTEALEIGAFCGNECRGSQLLTFYPQLNRYLVFLTLCGEAGDMLFFRLYNHELGEESVLGCASVLTFEDNGMLGSVEDPYAFNFTHIQNTAINEGWTWYSTFVELNGLNGIEMMTQGLGENGVMIKSQYQGFLTYDGGMWMGNLNSINNESMYLINTSANTVLSMAGNYAVPAQHALTLNPGWNWIGYTMASAADVNMALGNLNATNGDIVKARNGFASYVNGMGWLGSLNTFTPGEGFMYHSNKNTNVTFTYSEGAKGGELRQNITAEGNHYVPKMNAYPFNMSMMAVVEIEGTEVHDDAFEMAAFAGDECRGSVRLMDVEALNRYMAFLTIAGDETTTLSFRLLDLETGMTYYSDQSIVFEADAIVGDPMEPFTLRFMPAVTNCGELALAYDVYPNPVKAGEWVSLNGHSNLTSKVRVEVVNAMGVVVNVETLNSQPATLKVPAVPGVYMMRVITEGKGSQVYKLIVE